jgi:thioredoxin 1
MEVKRIVLLTPLMSVLVALTCIAATQADGPFGELGFEAAAAKAKSENKLLVVDFTANWCPPCKRMDELTWPDAALGKWLFERAVAIQVDVDEQTDLARKFGFTAVPTVIVLRNDEELGRFTGFRGPEDVLKWGESLLLSAIPADLVPESDAEALSAALVRAVVAGNAAEAHHVSAQKEMKAGRFAEALEDFLKTWDYSRNSKGWMGVRHSYLLSDIRKLADVHAPAKEALHDLLERAQANIDSVWPITWLDWIEWTSLCDSAADERTGGFREWPRDPEGRILAWYERRRDSEGRIPASAAVEEVRERIEADLFTVLIRSGRHLEAVRAGGDLRERVESSAIAIHSIENIDPDLVTDKAKVDGALDQARRDFLERNAPVYGALLAAGEDETARAVAAIVLETVDSAQARIALVTAALDTGKGHQDQLARWLDETSALGADVSELRARLAKVEPAPADSDSPRDG